MKRLGYNEKLGQLRQTGYELVTLNMVKVVTFTLSVAHFKVRKLPSPCVEIINFSFIHPIKFSLFATPFTVVSFLCDILHLKYILFGTPWFSCLLSLGPLASCTQHQSLLFQKAHKKEAVSAMPQGTSQAGTLNFRLKAL